MKQRKRKSFQITLTMEGGSVEKIITKHIHYKFSASYTDQLSINGRSITLEGSRANAVAFDDVFYNYNSEIHNQIIKSLCFYYCVNAIICPVEKLEIIDHMGRVRVFSKNSINQIIDCLVSMPVLSNLNQSALEIIFEDTAKGRAYYYALTYLIRSKCKINSVDAFEKIWKSFNSIYKVVSNKTKDHDCHKFLRRTIIDNPSLFPLSVSHCQKMDEKEIRRHVRWNLMIKNDYATQNKTVAFKDFVLRYSDYRIMIIIAESISVREEFLTSTNLYQEVEDYVTDKICHRTVNPQEIVTLLCIKYMYFIRNKSIHAEHIDPGFRLFSDSAQGSNTAWLSETLSLLVIDIFNSNNELDYSLFDY